MIDIRILLIGLCYVVAFQTVFVCGQCDPDVGPPGNTECVYSNITGYKWRTCLSNKYVKFASGGIYSYVDTNATYRWHMCQHEVLTSDCDCKKGDKAVPATLPGTCSSPEDDSCSWYKDCLLKKYPSCRNSSDSFSFASSFCQLQDNRNVPFTSLGKKWIGETRKCIQTTKWVPMLRPWNTETCEKDNYNFISEYCCYLANPSCSPAGTTSICDLPLSDWWKVFWSMVSSSGPISKRSIRFGGFVITTTQIGCKNRSLNDIAIYSGDNIKAIEIQLKFNVEVSTLNFTANGNRWVLKFLRDISSQVGWDENEKLGWFPYTAAQPLNSTILSIGIFLFDKSSLKNDVVSNKAMLNDTVGRFLMDVKEGKIVVKDKELKQLFQIDSVSWCGNMKCEQKVATVIPGSPPIKPTPGHGEANVKCWSFSMYVVLFILTTTSTKLFS